MQITSEKGHLPFIINPKKSMSRIQQTVITLIAIVDPQLLHAPYARGIIVMDEGTSGISEIPGTQEIDQALVEARALLIGKDVF
jgi:glucarate dehydratase